MEKTIQLGDKSVRLSNDILWALNYRDQFGKDIIPTLMPAMAAAVDLLSGMLNIDGVADGDIDVNKVLKEIDGNTVIDAMAHLSGLELVDLIEITWALAKTADDDIPEPRTWAKEIGDSFYVDEIAPVVFELIAKGVVSSKNLKRLEALKRKMRRLQPKSNSTTSYSQQTKED